MLRFHTAGESHGQGLIALVQGLPAGVEVDLDFLNRELRRRQGGYGRGGRMKIETDTAEILAGVRRGKTTGAPVAMLIRNRDWENWKDILPVEASQAAEGQRSLTAPRPGHADLAGCLKYDLHDARYILERASARESAARVAAGAMAKMLLAHFGIEVWSHVVAVGSVKLTRAGTWEEIKSASHQQEVLPRCADPATEAARKEEGDRAYKTGDTVGG